MRSMTGYGTAEGNVGKGRLFVEVKSVNHRFCDINLKLPPKMGVLEPYIRKYIQDKFSRGKIDVFFKEKRQLFGGVKLAIDIDLAKQYRKSFRKLSSALGLPKEADFLRYVGMEKFVSLEEREGSYEKLWRQIEQLMKKATDHTRMMQQREGDHLLKDQRRSVNVLAKTVGKIHRQMTRVMGQHERRVRKRIAGTQTGAFDEQRLQMEVAYLGSRQDISEELIRLESHIDQYRSLLRTRESIGRKLDFLLQEMNREVNTIGSKAADGMVSRLVVDCKATLERLREQVQNVE